MYSNCVEGYSERNNIKNFNYKLIIVSRNSLRDKIFV